MAAIQPSSGGKQPQNGAKRPRSPRHPPQTPFHGYENLTWVRIEAEDARNGDLLALRLPATAAAWAWILSPSDIIDSTPTYAAIKVWTMGPAFMTRNGTRSTQRASNGAEGPPAEARRERDGTWELWKAITLRPTTAPNDPTAGTSPTTPYDAEMTPTVDLSTNGPPMRAPDGTRRPPRARSPR
jgi:hypothetical protein